MIKEFVATNKATYTIEIDDFGEEITVTRDGVLLGKISLDLHWGEPSIGVCDHFKITSLELDKCKGIALGEQCLRFHLECFDAPLTAGDANRGESPDGSHLIGDGVGFIARMREKKIVCRSAFDFDQPDSPWPEEEATRSK